MSAEIMKLKSKTLLWSSIIAIAVVGIVALFDILLPSKQAEISEHGWGFYILLLIIFGALIIPAGKTDLQNKETPKGVNFWLRKMLVNILSVMTTLSLCNFLIPNHTSEFKHFVIWLCVCIICGILFGTFDYFAHNTGGDEAEFEAKRSARQHTGRAVTKKQES